LTLANFFNVAIEASTGTGRATRRNDLSYLTDKLTATMWSMAIRYSMATAGLCAVAGGILIWASARYVVQGTRRALEA
jgi:hypothetical protein